MCYKSKQLTHDSLEMGVLKINLDRLACKEPTSDPLETASNIIISINSTLYNCAFSC